MGACALVVDDIVEGANFLREFDRTSRVVAAFWGKISDNMKRYLYVATERFGGNNPREAYTEVIRLTTGESAVNFDPAHVRFISPDSPLAIAVIEYNQSFPNRRSNRIGDTLFGGHYVEDLYIYPPIAELPPS